jgi:hypothetical protein
MPTLSSGYRDGTSHAAQRHARMRAAMVKQMEETRLVAALKAAAGVVPETPAPILADRLEDLDRHDDAAFVREWHARG